MYTVSDSNFGVAGPQRSWLGNQVQRGNSSWLTSDPTGKYTIHASGADDLVKVSQVSVGFTKFLRVQVNGDTYHLPLTGRYAASSLGIFAGAGNDAVFIDPSVQFPVFVDGGTGDDYLKGGSGPNALLGGDGNDILIGGPQEDLLLGQNGFDTIQTGGGNDMTRMRDLFQRLTQGRCHREPIYRPEPSAGPIYPQPLSQPSPSPVVPAPLPPRTNQPIVKNPYEPPQRKQIPLPPKPSLSDLLESVDRYGESGFKSGRDMAKNLLGALYDGPAKLKETIDSIANRGERDDAVASFLRALLEAGPGGAQLINGIPQEQKLVLLKYLREGNAWSAQKSGLLLAFAEKTDRTLYQTIQGERSQFQSHEAKLNYENYKRQMEALV